MADFVDPTITAEIVAGKDKLVTQANRAETLLNGLESAIDNAGIADMSKTVYDPNLVQADAFSMDNMVEGTTTKIMTDAERTKLASVESGAEVNEVNEAPIDGQQYVRKNAAWEVNTGGTADMQKSVYDPTLVQADAFNMDNMVSGTTNKVFTATEQTKLAGIEAGAEVNTVDTVFGRSGAVVATAGDYDDSQVTAAASATNYTPTGATVEGHLAGIDTALASAGGGGDLTWTLLANVTLGVDTATLADNTLTANAYDEYKIHLYNVAPTVTANLQLQFYNSGTLLTTAAVHDYVLVTASGAAAGVTETAAAAQNQFLIADSILSNTTEGRGFKGELTMSNIGGVNNLNPMFWNGTSFGDGGRAVNYNGSGITVPTNLAKTITGFSFYFSTGNVRAGARMMIYGRNFP